jgi:molecular chaperone GrpE
VFAAHGIKPIDPLGLPFDPNLHNALVELDDPTKEPGTIAFVQKRGYTLHDRPLRVADVGIVRRRS